MRFRTRLLTALPAIALVAAGTFLLRLRGQDAAPAPLISAPNSSNGVVLQPGGAAALAVRVTDRQNQPLAGITVLFLAPDSGPSGVFPDASADTPTVFRVQTDSGGAASANFAVNDAPGVFLVDAIVEGPPVSGVTFAISAVTSNPGPALAPDQARLAVEQQILQNAVQDQNLALHGPVLLPEGAIISSLESAPYTTSGLNWFFWIDQLPGAHFRHPARFVLLDATNPVPDLSQARVTDEGWWPKIALPGSGAALSLLRPAALRLPLPPAAASSAEARIARSRIPPSIAPGDACVISIYGPPDSALANDSAHFADFAQADAAHKGLGIPAGNVFRATNAAGKPRPASRKILQSLIDQAVKNGCKKVFLYISAHGTVTASDAKGGNKTGMVLATDADPSVEDKVSYDDLATMLEALKASNASVCIILDVCYSAAAIGPLQGHGLSGDIVTAADDTGNSKASGWGCFGYGSYFTDALMECWGSLLASAPPGQLPSLVDAFDWVKKKGSSDANFGRPQIATIDPQGGVFPLTPVAVPKPGDTVSKVKINRPKNATGKILVKVTITDGSVAQFGNGAAAATKVMKAQDDFVEVDITGLAEGTTSYTATTTDDNQKTYSGSAEITVGDGYSVDPNPIRLKVGEQKSATVKRAAALQQTPGATKLTVAPKDAANTGIATASPGEVVFQPGQAQQIVTIQGVKAGTATFTAVDPATKKGTTFQVIVDPVTPPQSPLEGSYRTEMHGSGRQVRKSHRRARESRASVAIAPADGTGGPVRSCSAGAGDPLSTPPVLPGSVQNRPRGAIDAVVECVSNSDQPAAATPRRSAKSVRLDRLPMLFEPNAGQAGMGVRFVARGAGYGLSLRDTGLTLDLSGKETQARLTMTLAGANPAPDVRGLRPSPAVTGYLFGSDPAGWRTGIRNYRQVRYTQVYPGVDLVFYGNQQSLEYDFILSPGADPSKIRLVFDGARGMRVDRNGDLLLETAAGRVVKRKPRVYQESGGRRQRVGGSYVMRGANEAGFQIAAWDRGRTLVIDPVLEYATYLGGSGATVAQGIAIDTDGFVYVAGFTNSTNFPATSGAYQTASRGGTEAFVAKLNPTLTALVYALYLGGSGNDTAKDIAVDSAGNAYVAGYTSSANFPVTAGAAQRTLAPGNCGAASTPSPCLDAFAVKINASGSGLIYSTYFGGAANDAAVALAVDSSGSAYITGQTSSANLPVTAEAFQPKYAGGANCGTATRPLPCANAFVAKLNASGSQWLYATYLGGSGNDSANSIAVDGSGNAYVAGDAFSADFPVTPGAFQPARKGTNCGTAASPFPCDDAFVTALNASGTGLIYSTYLGGDGFDWAQHVALDSLGNAYVTGTTASANFPVMADAFQSKFGGGFSDVFYAVLDPAGKSLIASTYLGGSGDEVASSLALDGDGWVYLVGDSTSADFPER